MSIYYWVRRLLGYDYTVERETEYPVFGIRVETSENDVVTTWGDIIRKEGYTTYVDRINDVRTTTGDALIASHKEYAHFVNPDHVWTTPIGNATIRGVIDLSTMTVMDWDVEYEMPLERNIMDAMSTEGNYHDPV